MFSLGEWLHSLNATVWQILGALAAVALLAVLVVPLGQWFWNWLIAPGNALALTAIGVVALIAVVGAHMDKRPPAV